MLIYWALFAYFAIGTLLGPAPSGGQQRAGPLFALGAIATAILIGMRFEVGADWSDYLIIFNYTGKQDFVRALELGDPAYQLANWIVYQSDGEIWVVNLICAGAFSWGLFRLCSTQPERWGAVLISVPYLVIVVAMGYSRQAAALGVLMAGLASFLKDGSSIRFAGYVLVAALFHKTAVVAFPLVAFASERSKLINLLLVPALSLWLYDFFLGDAMNTFVRNYLQARYSSQGAAIRVGMNLAAAACFWIFKHRLHFTSLERRLWRNFSWAAVLMVFLLLVLPSSTAVDRMSLYICPLQIGVLGRMALAFRSRLFGSVLLIGYAFSVQAVWFNFARFAELWVPYRFFPILV